MLGTHLVLLLEEPELDAEHEADAGRQGEAEGRGQSRDPLGVTAVQHADHRDEGVDHAGADEDGESLALHDHGLVQRPHQRDAGDDRERDAEVPDGLVERYESSSRHGRAS